MIAPATETLSRFKELVYHESGICFTSTNETLLVNRINEKLAQEHLDSFEEYYTLVRRQSEKLKSLISAVTTGVTGFYRNRKQIALLEEILLPRYFSDMQSFREVRLWSAGCSTGEEAYTMAIAALEALRKISKLRSFRVFASDINLEALFSAKKGVYKKNKLGDVPPEILNRYFRKLDDDTYEISAHVKNHLVFDYHNLQNVSTHIDIDIVFCRNVIIYFDDETVSGVLGRIKNSLAVNGTLVLGHSESLHGRDTPFHAIREGENSVYRIKE